MVYFYRLFVEMLSPTTKTLSCSKDEKKKKKQQKHCGSVPEITPPDFCFLVHREQKNIKFVLEWNSIHAHMFFLFVTLI